MRFQKYILTACIYSANDLTCYILLLDRSSELFTFYFVTFWWLIPKFYDLWSHVAIVNTVNVQLKLSPPFANSLYCDWEEETGEVNSLPSCVYTYFHPPVFLKKSMSDIGGSINFAPKAELALSQGPDSTLDPWQRPWTTSWFEGTVSRRWRREEVLRERGERMSWRRESKKHQYPGQGRWVKAKAVLPRPTV